MDDPFLVRGVERVGDLARDRERLADRQRPASPSRSASVAPSTSSRTSAVHAIGLLEAVDRADVRVIERREQPRFALEAREAIGIGGEGRAAGS